MVDESDDRIVDKRAASRMPDGEGQETPPTEGPEGTSEL